MRKEKSFCQRINANLHELLRERKKEREEV